MLRTSTWPKRHWAFSHKSIRQSHRKVTTFVTFRALERSQLIGECGFICIEKFTFSENMLKCRIEQRTCIQGHKIVRCVQRQTKNDSNYFFRKKNRSTFNFLCVTLWNKRNIMVDIRYLIEKSINQIYVSIFECAQSAIPYMFYLILGQVKRDFFQVEWQWRFVVLVAVLMEWSWTQQKKWCRNIWSHQVEEFSSAFIVSRHSVVQIFRNL